MAFIISTSGGSVGIGVAAPDTYIAPGVVRNTAGTTVSITNGASAKVLLSVSGLVIGNTGVSADGSDDIIVTQDGVVSGTEGLSSGDGMFLNGNNNRVTVAGTVYGEDFGILANAADGSRITVAQSGIVRGGSNDNGADATPFSAAILALGNAVQIVNDGLIEAELNPDTGQSVAIASANFGASNGFDPTTSFSTTVINGGRILGDVLLFGGADTFDQRPGGTVQGRLDLGLGADRFFGGGTDEFVFMGGGNDTARGGAGDDTVYGMNDNDRLDGNAGDDLLNGGAGLDVISGGAGDDTLVGGNDRDILTGGRGDDVLNGQGGLDLYRFENGWGHDRILGFSDANAEKIDLRGVSAIVSFNDLKTNHLTQKGGSAVITAGDNTIVVAGVSMNALDAGDFLF